MSCGVGRRRSSDLALLWLWHWLVATAPIQPLAWEPPYGVGSSPTPREDGGTKGEVAQQEHAKDIRERPGRQEENQKWQWHRHKGRGSGVLNCPQRSSIVGAARASGCGGREVSDPDQGRFQGVEVTEAPLQGVDEGDSVKWSRTLWSFPHLLSPACCPPALCRKTLDKE